MRKLSSSSFLQAKDSTESISHHSFLERIQRGKEQMLRKFLIPTVGVKSQARQVASAVSDSLRPYGVYQDQQ